MNSTCAFLARILKSRFVVLVTAVVALSVFQWFSPQPSFGCACGCNVFDVGSSSIFPSGAGNLTFFEYDYVNQNQNWEGASSAAASDNRDKKIETSYFTVGDQYMIDRSWGVRVELPIVTRNFDMVSDTGDVMSFSHGSLGDIRLRGVYSGFSPDMSTGFTFGLKLPTGDYTYPNFDPDVQIGSGSLDLLFGIFRLNPLDADHLWLSYWQVNFDQPVLYQNGYIPGNEIDAAFGIYYYGITVGEGTKVAPTLELVTSIRGSDHGANPASDPVNTGYQRLLLAPGLSLATGAFRLYADVELPVYQYVNGAQLIAPEMFKGIASYSF